MVRIRKLKYLKMVWDEDRGNFIIITYDRETGEKTGHVVLNMTYMYSVIRFMLSIFQKYTGRGWRLARAKTKETQKGN